MSTFMEILNGLGTLLAILAAFGLVALLLRLYVVTFQWKGPK